MLLRLRSRKNIGRVCMNLKINAYNLETVIVGYNGATMFDLALLIFRFMHTQPKILMFCLDLKRNNKNCSSVAAYHNCFEVISMNFFRFRPTNLKS